MSGRLVERCVLTKYWHGDILYLRVCDERMPGMVTSVSLSAGGATTYWITWGNGVSTSHFECELTNVFVPNYDSDEFDGDGDEKVPT